ncbi:MAG: hypothetical protein ACNA8H_10365, partial [Anaerolineales bacterium]
MPSLLNAQILLILRIAMVVSLYAFLGMVIFILWQELRSQRSLLANRQPPLLKLTHATPEGSQTFQY